MLDELPALLLTALVTFTWDGAPGVAAYQVGCGPQPGKYNAQTFWSMDYGPAQATSITVEMKLNRSWYCAVRSWAEDQFSGYSNTVELKPTFSIQSQAGR
jgi:hypothetical protein